MDLLLDAEHLTQLYCGLGRSLEDSSEKEVVGQNFLLIPILALRLLVSFLLHVVEDLDHRRPLLPGELTNDPQLDLLELALDLVRHIWVKLQENVENSPKIKRRLIN